MIMTSMADEAREPTRDASMRAGQGAPGPRRTPSSREGQQRPAIPAQELADEREVGLEEEDTEQERASQSQRGRGHRGKPEKKKYEEFINDPYCE
ncbi:MAG: hypothetical protein METHP_00678 [Methanoregula sp. SKADARSKE-2]|nr:MAG: hypothetical protein METHP_00678 [Methanoregula sp. SKADARSKE-2]